MLVVFKLSSNNNDSRKILHCILCTVKDEIPLGKKKKKRERNPALIKLQKNKTVRLGLRKRKMCTVQAGQ